MECQRWVHKMCSGISGRLRKNVCSCCIVAITLDFFRHLLDDSCPSYLIQVPGPSLNSIELLVIHNCPCKHSSKLQLSIWFTPSRYLDTWCTIPKGWRLGLALCSWSSLIEPGTSGSTVQSSNHYTTSAQRLYVRNRVCRVRHGDSVTKPDYYYYYYY